MTAAHARTARDRGFSTTWSRRATRLGQGTAVTLAGGLLLAGCGATPPPQDDAAPPAPTATATETPEASSSPSPAPTPSPSPASAEQALSTAGSGTALELLAQLEVKGRAPTTGYDRAAFGQRWADVDRNGCDTRNDILDRDLTGVVTKPGTGGCKVLAGTLLQEPYTGQQVVFTQGSSSSSVDIDHVVALGDAWQKGAQNWTADKRRAFANDPLNLLAVDASENRAKGDGDAATWLPPANSYRCAYVARQASTKVKYGLWVTSAEQAAMARVLATCPQTAPPPAGPALVAEPPPPSTTPAPAPAPEPAPAPPPPAPAPAAPPAPAPPPPPVPAAEPPSAAPPPPAPAAPSVTYKNCDAARAAGAAPVRLGDPGYSRKLDRDGDGIGCE